MKGYIITLVCVIVVGAVLEILTPEGKFKKYIKPILGIMIVLTVVAPLLKSIDFNDKLDLFPNNETSQQYYNDVYQNNVARIFSNKLEENIVEYLKRKGISVSDCHVTADLKDQSTVITKVEITAKDKSPLIKEMISSEFGINKECIFIYE
jgi:Stage III sporulation protein AF (Spore_III_AF).